LISVAEYHSNLYVQAIGFHLRTMFNDMLWYCSEQTITGMLLFHFNRCMRRNNIISFGSTYQCFKFNFRRLYIVRAYQEHWSGYVYLQHLFLSI